MHYANGAAIVGPIRHALWRSRDAGSRLKKGTRVSRAKTAGSIPAPLFSIRVGFIGGYRRAKSAECNLRAPKADGQLIAPPPPVIYRLVLEFAVNDTRRAPRRARGDASFGMQPLRSPDSLILIRRD